MVHLGVFLGVRCNKETSTERIREMKSVFRLLAPLILVGVTAAACGGDNNGSNGATTNNIAGSLREWSVNVNADTAKTGTVTFTITNEGSIGHEFLIVKTDIENGKIPLVDGRFEEPSEGVEVIDEIEEFPGGETKELSVTLSSGNYQLVCNLPGHYSSGMHVGFVVVD